MSYVFSNLKNQVLLKGSSLCKSILKQQDKTIKATMVYPTPKVFLEPETLNEIKDLPSDKQQLLLKEQFDLFIHEAAGRFAAVCYSKDNVWDVLERSLEDAVRLSYTPLTHGHHSVAEHLWISVAIENIGKLTMMMLNNEKFYTTSEKSGRYTDVSTTCSEREKVLYEKWIPRFKELILSMYPERKIEISKEKTITTGFNEKAAKKLAQENCRNLCSIFFRSSLVYTASIRQWNYLLDYCIRFQEDVKTKFKDKAPKWLLQLCLELQALHDSLMFLYIPELHENKQRTFSLIDLNHLTTDPRKDFKYYADTFSTYFKATFPCLAQCHRHKTISYNMFFNEQQTSYYIPPILQSNEKLVAEWLQDLSSLKDIYPQGMMVDVRMRGTLDMFKLIPYERFCGRAQLETMRNMVSIYKEYIQSDLLTEEEKTSLEKFNYLAKCTWVQCKEPCQWGCNQYTRLI